MKTYYEIKNDFINAITEKLKTEIDILASDLIDSYDKEVYENEFYEIYDRAINKCLDNKDKVIPKNFSSPLYFAVEFMCHIDLGRRSGKTTYILQTATKNDIIFVKHYLIASKLKYETKAKVLTLDQFFNFPEINLGITFETIWFDDTDNKEKEYKALEILIKNCDQQVIKLGK